VVLVLAISCVGGRVGAWELQEPLHNHVKLYNCFGFSFFTISA